MKNDKEMKPMMNKKKMAKAMKHKMKKGKH